MIEIIAWTGLIITYSCFIGMIGLVVVVILQFLIDVFFKSDDLLSKISMTIALWGLCSLIYLSTKGLL